jgi:radical SAM superfamily enzyme YgiQ (UPF0313 family)
VVPREVVLADIRAQVVAGVEHITFGDPDFLNGPRHVLALVRALHAEFPRVTWDATIKIEHILERRALFAEFAELGCAFVVSAVESLSPEVLRHLKKGHTREDVVEALRILDNAGIPMRPTFVAFTPWTTPRDYLELLEFIAEHDLMGHVDPVQLSIRLLVPPGSALLEEPDAADWLGPLDAERFTYQWEHPDPRMDALQRDVAVLVESAARAQQAAAETFAAIGERAAEVLDLAPVAVGASGGWPLARQARRGRRPVPHLTEAWFC